MRITAFVCSFLLAVVVAAPSYAESLPLISGQLVTTQGENVSGVEMYFRDDKTLQSTGIKVDSKGQFIGQLPALGDYSVNLASTKNCVSTNFKYKVAASGQKLSITFPRKSKIELRAIDEKQRHVSGVSFEIKTLLEEVSNPEVGNPVFRCNWKYLTYRGALELDPIVFEGFAIDPKTEVLGNYTFKNLYSQDITSKLTNLDLKDGKITVKIEKTPQLQLNSKNFKFSKYTLNGTAEVVLPSDSGQDSTERTFQMWIRYVSNGKWVGFTTRTLKITPGSVTKFSTSLAAFKGKQVEVGLVGSDMSLAPAFVRVKVPK